MFQYEARQTGGYKWDSGMLEQHLGMAQTCSYIRLKFLVLVIGLRETARANVGMTVAST